MHVLMTGDTVGGVWQYGLDLAHGLRARDHQVTIAVLGPRPSAHQMEAARAIAGCRIVPLDLPLDWTAKTPAAALEAGAAVARFARSAAADIVHLHSPVLAAGGAFAGPVVAVCHSCIATWWDAVGTGPLPADLAWRVSLTGEGFRRADALLAPTRTFAAETARVHRLPQPPTVVRNGRRPRPAGSQRAWTPTAFTAGRLWDRAKNMEGVDRVAARLSFPVVAAGAVQGPHRELIRLKHVRLVGQLSDAAVAEHLACRPIFISLARYEPFGLAVLEAAQAGCALVLSDIATFRELWDDAATFVSPDDPAATAGVMERLAADPAARLALGEAAARARRTLQRRGDDGRRARRLSRRAGGAPGAGAGAGQHRRCAVKVAYFTHSLASCWNHGNAHFLRGVLRELIFAGHEVELSSRMAHGAWPTCCATTASAASTPSAAPIPNCDAGRSATPTAVDRAARGRSRHRPRVERAGAGRRARARCASRGDASPCCSTTRITGR